MHYHFVDDDEFDRMERGRRAARVGGRARPQPLRHPPRARSSRRCATTGWRLLEIDLQGARQVRATMPEALFVFLAPPSWDELVRRLVGRGTEDEEERTRRLDTAKVEMAAEDEFDVTIVNDDVRRAAEELVSLMRSPLTSVVSDADARIS